MEKSFSKNLKELMAARRLSARQLATEMGIAHKSILDWLQKENTIPRDPKVLKRLATFFGCSVHRLLYGSEDEQSAIAEILQNKVSVFSGVFEITVKKLELDAGNKKKGQS